MLNPTGHVDSYYAATLNDHTAYPVLRGDQSADVCVIGAGFTGISTALHLAERGYRVCVVEAHRVGWGASGRNGGQIIAGISGEQRIARHHRRDVEALFRELRWEGNHIIRERVRRYDLRCDLKWGYLDVAIKPRHLRALAADCERHAAAGLPDEIRLVDRDETRALIGTDAYLGGLLNMANGHLHPLNLCLGEAAAASAQGATIYEGSRVLRIVRGRRPRVETAQGAVTADAVVIAGNAYHALEDELRGIMFPVNSFIVGTEPLDPATVERINPRDLAVCDPNFLLEYFRLTADKRLLFGARTNYRGSDADHVRSGHRRRIARLYPELGDVRLEFAWGGTIGVPLNRVPQLGRLAPDVYYCQGYSGHGVNVTHLAGRIMADAVGGTLEQFDLFAAVKPVVVPGAARFAGPLVTLGTWYYRIRDRL